MENNIVDKIVNNINIYNIDKEYLHLAELYIEHNNIQKNMLNSIEKHLLVPYYDAYKPETGQIFINSRLDKKINKDLKYDPLVYKYKINKQELINIIKLTYFMHELRHILQFDIYINKSNTKNLDTKENLYKKILSDFIEIIKKSPKVYLKYYDENILEKDAEMTSYINTIKILKKINNKENILSYMIDYYLENTIRKGYQDKNIEKPSIQKMYNLIGKEKEYQIIKNEIEKLNLYEKLSYNSQLTKEEIKLIKNNNKEEIIKSLIK